ncbi:hypothetical protein B566_EDAN015926 [Ephemera danica]|nr:hypothetical protein B566_EDAN015926 [Ephemera danica]
MSREVDDLNLTSQELQVLSELDSRQFGFLKLSLPEQCKKRALVLKAVKCLEGMIVAAQRQKERNKQKQESDSTPTSTVPDSGDQEKPSSSTSPAPATSTTTNPEAKEINIDPKTYCKLGHFHLLLENFSHAMSAYQKFLSLKSDYWKDPNFLYGQGLVYFHFNAFQW